MVAGRPTKYNPAFCDRIPTLMAIGMSKVEVCAELGIDYTTFLAWQEKHPEFSKSVKKGDQLSEAWWMREGREALRDREFNHALWYMNMKNRHGWADKQEAKLDGSMSIKINVIDSFEEADE